MKKALIINRANHEDIRGSHIKFLGLNVTGDLIPGFHAKESYMTVNNFNTIRGMHFQSPFPQQKLITVISGEIIVNVFNIVDPSERITEKIDSQSGKMVFIPEGWALGYRAVSKEENARVLYLADADFVGLADNGIDPFDSDLHLDWSWGDDSKPEDYILSERDHNLLSYKNFMEKYEG